MCGGGRRRERKGGRRERKQGGERGEEGERRKRGREKGEERVCPYMSLHVEVTLCTKRDLSLNDVR